jgi:hypothetical protein
MWNLIIGIVFIVGGLTGKMALLGTNSGPALAVFGAVLLVIGIMQLKKSKES